MVSWQGTNPEECADVFLSIHFAEKRLDQEEFLNCAEDLERQQGSGEAGVELDRP